MNVPDLLPLRIIPVPREVSHADGCDCGHDPHATACALVTGYGELSVTRHYPERGEGRGWLTIERADPRVLVAADLLAIISAHPAPGARLVKTCACSPDIARLCPHYCGAKLEIRAENGSAVYVVTPHPAHMDLYVAEWPD